MRQVIYADIASFKTLSGYQLKGFAMDKNGIYFFGELLKMDTTGFEVVGEGFKDGKQAFLWKNKDKVFENTTWLNNMDAPSFEAVNCFLGPYLKDKNFLYYFDKKIENSDPFSAANNSCDERCYDKNNVYYKGELMYTNDHQKLLPVNDLITKTQSHVYSLHYGLISKMDAPSLKGLSRKYSVDKNHIYFDTTTSPIKRQNFKNIKIWDQVNSSYISDGINVYAGTNLVSDFNASSFGMLPHSDFCYDKDGIYGRKQGAYLKFPFNYILPIDPENIAITDNSAYIIYNNQAYYPSNDKFFQKLTKTQIATLKSDRYYRLEEDGTVSIGSYFRILNDKLFIRNEEVKDVDIATFSYIFEPYYKDKNHVYQVPNIKKLSNINNLDVLEGADPGTFKPYTHNFFKDKDYIYCNSQKLISCDNIQLLAVFRTHAPTVYKDRDEDDHSVPDPEYYLFKNKKGFWLIEISATQKIDYLGATFNPKWNKIFEKFDLPTNL